MSVSVPLAVPYAALEMRRRGWAAALLLGATALHAGCGSNGKFEGTFFE